MQLIVLEVSLFSLWICCVKTRVSLAKKQINTGFIIDEEDKSSERAYRLGVELLQMEKNTIKIKDFLNKTNIADSYSFTKSICLLLMETIFSIVTAADVRSYDAIESYSQAMHVPVIIYNDVRKLLKPNYKYLLHIAPPHLKAVVDFIKLHKWRTVFYLHVENDPLWPWRVSEIFTLTNASDKINIIQRHLGKLNDSYEQLRILDKMALSQTEKIFILDILDRPTLQLILKQITELGMNREGYNYIIGGMDIQEVKLKSFEHGGARITGFQIVDKNGTKSKVLIPWEKRTKSEIKMGIKAPPLEMKDIFLLDSFCFLQQGFEKINRERPDLVRTRTGIHYNTNSSKEIVCHKHKFLERGPIILEFLKNTSAPCLSGNVQFDKNGYRTKYNFDVHSLYKKKLKKIGNWSSETGYNRDVIDALKKKPKEHKGPYIVTLVVEAPFVINKTDKNGKEVFEGFCIDMFKKLANSSQLQLDYVIRKRNDTKYGAWNKKTKSWDGMISELIEGEADIALGSISITEEREHVVDFTKPFMNTGISIMIKRPDKQKPNILSFKEPFSNSMWICIMCGFAGVSLVLVLIGRFSPYEWQNNSNTGPSEDFSVLNSLWSSFGALLQQGSDFLPSSISGRIAECAWWFFTLIIVSSYTANLAAFLTVEKLNIPINSADDLAKQSKIKYGISKGGSTEKFFSTSNVSVYKQMWEFMEATSQTAFVNGNLEGWNKVLEGKGEYAFLLESTSNDYRNQQKPCKTMKVGHNLNQYGIGIATKQGSELSRKLNLALLEIIEKGELINLKQRWWYDKGQCGQSTASVGKKSLSLSNVAGTFHIVIGGLVIAMIFSALEFLFHHKKNQRKQSKVIKTNLITDMMDIGHVSMERKNDETQPLKPPNINGAKDNKGHPCLCRGMLTVFKEQNNSYQTTTTSPSNLIMFDSITENGSTML
ncbi:glutamate receptor 3-like isoform X1 [Mytilus galloprovincialis]|uniref:glutamate receptor 3-like isoform X1 n=1 Tax=Mytilus galloprovincialis TaxID=29158 RepID=UPI003F7C9F54